MQRTTLSRRIKNKISLEKKLALIRFYSRNKTFHENDLLMICGDPRGGSTWLAEILAELPTTALLWEPLHLNHTDWFKNLGFGWRQHIPINAEWEEAKQAFSSIFQGKVLNEWTLLKTDPKKFKDAHQLLIKFCRANALLPWLCENYNFKYKPIYLIRHPFAVVASQLKQGGWNYAFSGFEIPQGPFSEYYEPHIKFLLKLKSKEEALVASWCLANKLIISTPPQDRKWIQITYEEMLIDPQRTIDKILNGWDKPFTEAMRQKVGEKSSTTLEGSPIHDTKKQLENWRNSFTPRQIYKMQHVLDYFGIFLYSSQPLPNL